MRKKQDDKQVYLEERKQSIEAEQDTAKQFDKSILTLSFGALALSLITDKGSALDIGQTIE